MSASAVNIHAANVAEQMGNAPEEKATTVAPEEQTANDEKTDDKGIGKSTTSQ